MVLPAGATSAFVPVWVSGVVTEAAGSVFAGATAAVGSEERSMGSYFASGRGLIGGCEQEIARQSKSRTDTIVFIF
jgi:hypothetical protein